MSALLELAERCEAATGDNFDLNHAIAAALGIASEPFTGSLDAALTLVPEGWDWAVFRTNGGLTVHAWCGSREEVFGATPALALCVAALRARAAGESA